MVNEVQDAIIRSGKVTLVGAGPGDADLLTVRALRAIENADVIAYDELISDDVRALFPKRAHVLPVGRRANGTRHHDERIHPEVIRLALAGCDVVRLKGGDPMMFGRGGEEIEALDELGIPWEVVPGVTAALGAAAAFGFPLTHRDASAHVTFATAHFAKDDGDERALELAKGLPGNGTIVLYMGLSSLERLSRAFIEAGRAESTPVAVISRATLPDERIVKGTLAGIAESVRKEDLLPPALVVLGEVTNHAHLAQAHPAIAAPPESETRFRSAAADSRPGVGELNEAFLSPLEQR